MVTDSLWMPRSGCDTSCLPAADAGRRVSRFRIAARAVAALVVIAVAAVALPVFPLLTSAARGRVLRLVARALLAAIGVRHSLRGRLPRQGALIVANHVSWLDVLVLLAYAPVRLLAKREVRSWPVVGALAAVAGTVFIDRGRPRTLPGVVAGLTATLRAGGVIAVFPEGTTWCGRTGGRFRPAMFQAAVDARVPVAPVTLRFQLADDSRTTLAAFVGDDTLLASLRRVLAARGLRVTARAHPALYPGPGATRTSLARAAQAVVQGVQAPDLPRSAVSRSWTVDRPIAPPTVQGPAGVQLPRAA